jgi:hypothetical protein
MMHKLKAIFHLLISKQYMVVRFGEKQTYTYYNAKIGDLINEAARLHNQQYNKLKDLQQQEINMQEVNKIIKS